MVLGRTAQSLRRSTEVTYSSQYSGTTVLDSSGALVPFRYGAFNLENMAAHGGSGTSTLMVRRYDRLSWVVLFDQRDDPSGLGYGDIDPLLHQAANAVGSWPTTNLFPNYGL